MIEEFKKILEQDETVLFYGQANVNKTANQLVRWILAFIFVAVIWILNINEFKKPNNNIIDLIIAAAVIFFITVVLIYGFINNFILKYKSS